MVLIAWVWWWVWRFLLGLLLLLFGISGWVAVCVGFVCLVCCFSVVVGWQFAVVGFGFLFVVIDVIFICVCYLVVWVFGYWLGLLCWLFRFGCLIWIVWLLGCAGCGCLWFEFVVGVAMVVCCFRCLTWLV